MIRSVTVVAIAIATLAIVLLAGCGSPMNRAEGRVVLTTLAPSGSQSSDVAIGAPAAGDTVGAARADEATRPVRTLAVSSTPPALDLASRNGSMTVVADPGVAGLTITADLRCGGFTMQEARDRLARATVEVSEGADGTLRVRPVMPGGWKNGDGASFEVSLPTAPAVTAHTSNGSIRLEGCRGPIDVDTSNGRLTFIGIDGDIVAETSNGRIVMQDTVGDVQARSSNGSVEVVNHLGGLTVRTSNGSMRIELNDASDAPVVARTSNGSVELSVGPDFGGWVRANTSNGSVSLDGAPRTEGSISLSKRSMAVKLVGDEDESRIDSSNGRVRVVVRGG